MSSTLKSALQLFGIVPAGVVLYGLARGHAVVETLIAAVVFSVFVMGIAWIGKITDARLKRK
jgi:hypothetical protein